MQKKDDKECLQIGGFLKEDMVVQEICIFAYKKSRSCRKTLKEPDVETEHVDSAGKIETTKFPTAFRYILKYLGL